MPRNPANKGLGRGKAPGSRATQFSSENWTGNAEGRPRQSRQAGHPDPFVDAVKKRLRKKITMTQDDKVRKMFLPEAMIEVLINSFSLAEDKDKLAIFRSIAQLAAQPDTERPPEMPSDQARAEFLEKLARECGVDEHESYGHRDPADRRVGGRLN